MTLKWDTNTLSFLECVGGRVHYLEVFLWINMKFCIVQISVVVARIKVKILKIEEEKGSMWTLFGHGLIGSNIFRNCYKYRKRFCFILQNFCIIWRHFSNNVTQNYVSRRCLFLLKFLCLRKFVIRRISHIN